MVWSCAAKTRGGPRRKETRILQEHQGSKKKDI